MRSAAAIIAGLVAAAVVGLVVAALVNDRPQAFTLGVAPSSATELPGGREACQSPITVPAGAAFDGVALTVGTGGRPGPQLDVAVREADPDRADALRGATLARGTLEAGYPDVDRAPEHTVWTGRVSPERSVAVCIANRGRRPVLVYGDVDAAARTSMGFVDAQPTGYDIALRFVRREPESLAALAPAMVERATLFRPRIVGEWTYVVVALLVLLGVPALLVLALRAAGREAA